MDVFIYRDFLTVAKVAVAFIDYQVFSLGRGIKPIVGKIFSLYTVNIDKRSNILSGRFKLLATTRAASGSVTAITRHIFLSRSVLLILMSRRLAASVARAKNSL